MCSVCFSAFERLATLVYNLDSNLNSAIDAICNGKCLPKSKRMKTTSTRAKLTTSLTGDLNSNKSPIVFRLVGRSVLSFDYANQVI